ncbi:hypothetical protein N5079_02745 [Planotetraspora sp. A-T 1434]|uniref:hypothetical protein n=1 Tax=Planotetraspora sp. A-T 1434 TaxID=2979219 RepID=UPI0021BFF5D1|nr:hypothetical protein [Planotetraspora sp. A-T 1434]MCT9929134.1 hypothetical protein [Planotetraspora sp. A-T 1434]
MELLGRQRFVLDAVGLAVAVGLFVFSLRVDGAFQELVIGIATSFVFAAMLDLLVVSQGRVLNRARIKFFGHELAREQTTLVYPDFVMHEDVRVTLKTHNQQMLFQRPNSRFQDLTIHRIDIPRTVAANDVQAMLYVADAFESTLSCPNVMVVDSAIIDACNRSFISFGLSSNDCTHLYVHEDPRPLFEIVDDESGSEFIRLRTGKEYASTAKRQYGIILRYSPSPEEHRERRWIIVAGLGPVGTTAAGWYLSRHWRSLAAKIPRSSNFVAVVSTGSYTDRVPHLEEIVLDQPG